MSSTFSLGLFLLFFTDVHVLVDSLPDEFLSKEGCCLLRITYNLIFVKKGMHIISYFSFQMTWAGGEGEGLVVVLTEHQFYSFCFISKVHVTNDI